MTESGADTGDRLPAEVSKTKEAVTGRTRDRLVDQWLAEHQEAYGAFDESELRLLAAETGLPYLPRRS